MKELIRMSGRIRATFVTKHFDDRTTFGITGECSVPSAGCFSFLFLPLVVVVVLLLSLLNEEKGVERSIGGANSSDEFAHAFVPFSSRSPQVHTLEGEAVQMR